MVKKRFSAFLLAVLSVLGLCMPCVSAESELLTATSPRPFCYYDNKTLSAFAGISEPHTEAVSAIAVNLETGLVISENNPRQLLYPASTVKLMTAVVAVEHIPDLETVIYASETAVNRSSGTRLNPTRPIKAGEALTARELLYGLLVAGANDAAEVLAEYVGGSREEFCALMNRKAAEIGAKDTHFSNPTGMHEDDMVTTAYDTALIAQYAYYLNDIVEIAGATNYTIEATEKTKERRYLYNRNRMIRRVEGETDYFYKGTLGLSAGYTPQGGNCVVAVAKKEGLTYLTVVMNAPEIEKENYAYADSVTLLDYCFNGFAVKKVAASGGMICEIPVTLAAKVDHVTLYAKEDIVSLLPADYPSEDVQLKQMVYEDAQAPIREGQPFGELVATYKGTVVLGKCELVANTAVDRSNLLYILSLLAAFFTSRWFIVAFIAALVLFAIYCILYYKAFMRRHRFRH